MSGTGGQGDASGLGAGIQLIGMVAVGVVVGLVIGLVVGGLVWFALAGGLLGLVAGFYSVYTSYFKERA
jgi:F0F1-type ATP synthase assembly protein I